MSLSDSVIEGLGRLRVTQGEGEGRLLTVFPWQRRFIRGALQDGVEESALSVSRGCGKTTLCAGIATAALAGPLSATRGETVCVASSFDQSRLVFEHVLAFIDKALQNDRGRWRVQDSSNRASIEGQVDRRARPLHRLGPAASSRTRARLDTRGRTGAMAREHVRANDRGPPDVSREARGLAPDCARNTSGLEGTLV